MFYVIVAINRSKRKEKCSLLFSIIGYLFSCFRINSVFGNVGRGKKRRNDRKCYRLSFCIKVIQKGRNHFPSPRVCNPLTGAHRRELKCGVIFVFISNIYMRPTSLLHPRTRCSLSIFFSPATLKSPRLLHNQTWQHHDLHHRKLPPRPSKSSSLTHRHHSPAVGRKKRFGFDLELSASCICLYFFFLFFFFLK